MRDAHPVFDRLPPDTLLWRYFDLPKFCALLEMRALYFCRADLLGDPLEGSFTNAMLADKKRLLENPPDGLTKKQLEDVFSHNKGINERLNKAAYVNCWQVGDYESMAMWRGYGGDYGVAIQTTAGLLDDFVPKELDEFTPIFIGPVYYLDYESESERIKREGNVYGMFMCKSLPYRYESEVRAMFIDLGGWAVGKDMPPGALVPVDLESLIMRVVVSPLAPPWFDEVVKGLLARFGPDKDVVRSTARRKPVY